VITYVLFAHFVSDFVLQTRWMAENKSKNGRALLSHILVYTVGMCCFLTCYLPEAWYNVCMYCALNGFLHFCVDYVTSQASSYYYSVNDKMFWCVIGADQWAHGAILINTIFILEFAKQ
jgi:hypothetical protein